MCKKMPVDITTTINHTIASATYLNGDLSFLCGAEVSLIGYPKFVLCVPFPSLDGEVNVEHNNKFLSFSYIYIISYIY
jgi:hypothetical protein